MAVLTKKQILERIQKKSITVSPPLDIFQLQAHSIDLRLGFTFLVPKLWRLTTKGREALAVSPLQEAHGTEYCDVLELEKGQYFDLLPQEYVLVSSLETIKVPDDLMAILYPRSSINRRGLSVDLTGIIDSGYEGQLTLPVRNNTRSQTVRIYPGERFCQIVFEELVEPIKARKSRYHKRDIIEGVAKEKQSETRLILSGNVLELKKKYAHKEKP